MMGLLSKLGGRYQTLSQDDERFWSDYQPRSLTGMRVTTETALRLSTVWACVRLISSSLASTPLITYRRLEDGGRQRAANHPIYGLLHDAPNEWQTAFEFKRLMTTWALLRGNGLAFIRPGARGLVDSLEPIHPNRYRPPEMIDGRLRYPILNDNNRIENHWPDEIFHLCGLTLDGFWGVSVIEYARESMGLAQATEAHAALFFSQNATPAGLLIHPGRVDKAGRRKIRAEWEEDMSGLSNAHRIGVLAEDIKYQPVGINAEDSQLLETRAFQVADIARWFGVDLTLLQEGSKSTSWGTGIEQMLLAMKTFTLLPWGKLWEGAVSRDLIMAPQTYYAEFLWDALVVADIDTKTRAQDLAIKGGWLSRNEVRRLNNYNAVPGLDGYDRPLNVGDATASSSPLAPPPANPGDENQAHYRELLEEAAGRVARKETVALGKAAQRIRSEIADEVEALNAWEAAVDHFYEHFAQFVAQTMRISPDAAQEYVAQRVLTLITEGPGQLSEANWTANAIGQLMRLADAGLPSARE